MQGEGFVLLLSGGEGIDVGFRRVLTEAGVHVRIVRTCAEAVATLKSLSDSAVLFWAGALPDGTGAGVLSTAAKGERHVPVIVVSRVVDFNLYINALEKGASDFIAPRFYRQDISREANCATENGNRSQTLAAAWRSNCYSFLLCPL